jgi:hypothetical protein
MQFASSCALTFYPVSVCQNFVVVVSSSSMSANSNSMSATSSLTNPFSPAVDVDSSYTSWCTVPSTAQLPVSVTFSSHLCPSSRRPLRRHHCNSHLPRKIDLRIHAAHRNRQRTTTDVTCPIDPCQPHAYMCHRSPRKTLSHVLHLRRAHHTHHLPPRIVSRRARVTTATDGIVGLSVIKVITYLRSRKKPWQTYPHGLLG